MHNTEPYSRRALIRAGLIGAAALGAGLPAWPSVARAAQSLAPDLSMTAANLDFSFRLYAALDAPTTKQNLIISPLSISLALVMAYNGAHGATQQAMHRALGLTSMQLQEINTANAALLAGLTRRDPHVALQIADSLWVRQGLALVPAFVAALKNTYGAPVTSLDFTSPRTPGVINAWVNAHTHGLIPSIVKAIDPKTVLFLINALYFKAPWSVPFPPYGTRPRPFTLQDDSKANVPMMAHTGSYQYYRGSAFEAIALPYASGQFNMYVFLPAAGSSLQAFQAGLSARTWATYLSNLTGQQGSITLPRFTVDYSTSLNTALRALGMSVAFDPLQADFSGMVQRQQVFISQVLHKAIMEVNEHGTLAAAVTSIGVGATAIPASSFNMVVDRPFFCAIRDETTGTLLFMGSILDPR